MGSELEHVSKFENIIIQLGICALVVLAGTLLALTWMKRQAKSDDERNAAYAKAEADRTAILAAGFRALTESHALALKTVTDNHVVLVTLVGNHHATVLDTLGEHQLAELKTFNELGRDITALNTKIDVALDLTPVRGTRRPEPSVIVSKELQEEARVQIPEKKTRAPTGTGYGPLVPKKA